MKNAYLYKKERDMKKEAKVEYGIAIVKPWSTEMYDHNEEVADKVRVQIITRWVEAMNRLEESIEDDEELDTEFLDLDWEYFATEEMLEIQRAVTCYGFGFGHTVEDIDEIIGRDIEDAPLFRLKEIAEELELVLEKGFIGFN